MGKTANQSLRKSAMVFSTIYYEGMFRGMDIVKPLQGEPMVYWHGTNLKVLPSPKFREGELDKIETWRAY